MYKPPIVNINANITVIIGDLFWKYSSSFFPTQVPTTTVSTNWNATEE